MKMKFCIVGLTALAFALAFAGIPCQDPASYHLIDGGCTVCPFSEGDSGYYVTTHILTHGGCFSPGHSENKCHEGYLGMNYHDGVVTNPFSWHINAMGKMVSYECSVNTGFILGVKYGEDSHVPCDYCTGANQ